MLSNTHVCHEVFDSWRNTDTEKSTHASFCPFPPDSSWLFLRHEVYYSRSWDPWARFSWRFSEWDKKRKEGRPRKLPGLFPDWETLDMRFMKAVRSSLAVVTMLSIDYSYSNRSLTVGIPLQLANYLLFSFFFFRLEKLPVSYTTLSWNLSFLMNKYAMIF